MSTITFDEALLPFAGTESPVKQVIETPKRIGFFSRLIAALQESRMRAAQREIERLSSTYRLHLGAYDRELHLVGRGDSPFQN